MQKKSLWGKRIAIFIVIFVAINFIYLVGYWAGQRNLPAGLIPDSIAKLNSGKAENVNFSIFWEAWNKLKEKSVMDIPSDKMVDGAISGMLSATDDPYTVYFTKEENQRFREDIQGAFSGIGIEIVEKDNLPTVVAPLPDTPAQKAGFKPGDIILEVDGEKTSDLGFDKTIDKIRGDEGTEVTIKIQRADVADPIIIKVKREKITVKSVEWDIKNVGNKKIGYIKIRQFGDDTEDLFDQAAKEMISAKPAGIILDLRNDPGGYLETSVDIASYFIKDGVIVTEKGRNNNSKEYRSTKNGKLKDFKVVVLVNNGSASASEILSGAFKDRLNSQIVGEKTFGKGSVQELIDLSDGSAVKITVAKWYTPGGKQINGEGIEPDIKVTDDENTPADEQLERALQCFVAGE